MTETRNLYDYWIRTSGHRHHRIRIGRLIIAVTWRKRTTE